MKPQQKQKRKNYAMFRMAEAISRAIRCTTPADKARAARWAAAWGVISGIRSPGVRLRRTVLADNMRERRQAPR